jgi:hypothetical protein
LDVELIFAEFLSNVYKVWAMIDKKYKVRRYIAEYELSSFDLARFQVEFNEPNANYPMCDCYLVKPENEGFLRPYLQPTPDWDFVKKHTL